MTHNNNNTTTTTTNTTDSTVGVAQLAERDELWAAYTRQVAESDRLRLCWSELFDREQLAWCEYQQASARRRELYDQAMQATVKSLSVLRAVADRLAG